MSELARALRAEAAAARLRDALSEISDLLEADGDELDCLTAIGSITRAALPDLIDDKGVIRG